MKCNESEQCKIVECHHYKEHDKVDYFGNSCILKCDVRGGIPGAICEASYPGEELEQDSFNP